MGAASLRLYPSPSRQARFAPIEAAAFLENGAIAQLGERFNGIEEVVGSIPSGSTNIQMTSSSSSASSAKSGAKLTDFKALTFDCYGTLIDWESGMIEALRPLTSKASRKLTRDQILEAHARHESSQQVQTPAKPYRDLLATVYRRFHCGVEARAHNDNPRSPALLRKKGFRVHPSRWSDKPDWTVYAYGEVN